MTEDLTSLSSKLDKHLNECMEDNRAKTITLSEMKGQLVVLQTDVSKMKPTVEAIEKTFLHSKKLLQNILFALVVGFAVNFAWNAYTKSTIVQKTDQVAAAQAKAQAETNAERERRKERDETMIATNQAMLAALQKLEAKKH